VVIDFVEDEQKCHPNKNEDVEQSWVDASVSSYCNVYILLVNKYMCFVLKNKVF